MMGRLLLRSLARRAPQKALATAVVWAGLTLIVALVVLGLEVGDRLNLEMASFGANIRIEPLETAAAPSLPGVAPQAYLETAQLARLKRSFWASNILGISPRLETAARAQDRELRLVGLWFDHALPTPTGEPFVTGARQVYRHWQLEGAWPASEDEVLLGRKVAARLALQPGDALVLDVAGARHRVGVSGIVTTGEVEDEAVLASLESVQRWTGLAGKFSSADVTALVTPENVLAEKYRRAPESLTPEEFEQWLCTPYPGSVAADIEKALPGASARVVRRVTETQGALLERLEPLMLALALLAGTASVVSTAAVLERTVRERRTEMALLRAMGARRAQVLRLALLEAGLLGGAGGLLAAATGVPLGGWLVQRVFGSPAEPHWILLAIAPLLGGALATLATWSAVLRALRAEPAPLLAGGVA